MVKLTGTNKGTNGLKTNATVKIGNQAKFQQMHAPKLSKMI